MLYAELDSFEPLAIQEHEAGDAWRVFFRTSSHRDAARRALASEFENALELHAIDVDDEDWARRSQSALKAVRAGKIVIAPPWDAPPSVIPDPDTIVIIIDPSTGFGTGHHATTRLCLELLQDIELRGTRVIDLGTGSGVLAIAAAKLGARDVVAIDNDPDALRNARDNVQRNDAAVGVLEADLSELSVEPADVVVGNLTAAVLQRFGGRIRKLANDRGTFIVSGFSPDDIDDVSRSLRVAPV